MDAPRWLGPLDAAHQAVYRFTVQLTPRYEGVPAISIEGTAGDQREPLLRQRRRMQHLLAHLAEEQWRSPSRCEDWTVQDVIAHLIGTNGFWRASIAAGLAGSPTRVLDGFDPAATPPLLVAAMGSMTPAATLEMFAASNQALFDTIDSIDEAGWSAIAEAPPGHLPIHLVAQHALWDAWVHERDILLPLAMSQAEEPDEIIACLQYVTALCTSLTITDESRTSEWLVVDATRPDTHFVVEIGATVTVTSGPNPSGATYLGGCATDLVEMLSIRMPLDPSITPACQRLVGALALVFDAPTIPD